MNKVTGNMDHNTISHYRNLLVEAIGDKVIFPKMIIAVPDDDILKYINITDFRISEGLGRVIDWLMCEHDRIVEIHKEHLPAKAKWNNYPQFLWIEAPVHDNFNNNLMRQKYNHTVNTAV